MRILTAENTTDVFLLEPPSSCVLSQVRQVFPWRPLRLGGSIHFGRCFKHPSLHRFFICLIIISAISASLR